ncbi:MAG: polysaccharide deacetylase family protein [Acidimicrobiales bacterium]
MQRRRFLALSAAGALGVVTAGCSNESSSAPSASSTTDATPGTASPATTLEYPASSTSTTKSPPVPGTPAEVLARSHVPALCYHQLRDFEPGDSAYARTIITPPAVLRTQLEALRDGGHTPVTATAVVDHLQFGTPLPDKAVLLSFDDGSVTHYTVAVPLLQELGFPAIFFPMTVVFDKPRWLSEDQLVEMDRSGMEIGAHTYDHQRMDKISGDEWNEQIVEPKAKLEQMLGHPVDLFAYPNGLFTAESLTHVADAGFRAAFQLAEPTDSGAPLLTIRRIEAPPTWDGPELLARIDGDF